MRYQHSYQHSYQLRRTIRFISGSPFKFAIATSSSSHFLGSKELSSFLMLLSASWNSASSPRCRLRRSFPVDEHNDWHKVTLRRVLFQILQYVSFIGNADGKSARIPIFEAPQAGCRAIVEYDSENPHCLRPVISRDAIQNFANRLAMLHSV